MITLLQSQLTWHQSGPAPFESAWSIFTKILALNHISVIELVRLIQKSHCSVDHGHPRLFMKSDWVDFPQFAGLLGVEAARLKNGFLDQLGFQTHTKLRKPYYAVRHCPLCLSLGYHCALFDLAVIQECPWHNTSLRHGCRLCASPYSIQRGKTCNRCGAVPPTHALPQAHTWLTEAQSESIETYCNAFLDWWRTVSDRKEQFGEVIDWIADLRPRGSAGEQLREQHLAYVRAMWPGVSRWKLGTSSKEFMVDAWKAHLATYPGIATPVRMDSDLGRSYRSIRRHILKHYIKGHEKCLAAFRKLSVNDRLSLNANAVCPLVLAYMSWKVSIEGLERRKNNNAALAPNTLKFISAPGTNMENSSRIRLSYLNFFGILNQVHTALRRSTLSISFSEQSAVYVQTRIKFAEGDAVRNFSDPVTAEVSAMAPLIQMSEFQSRCPKSSGFQQLVSGEKPYRPTDSFGDASYRWRQYFAFIRKTEASNITPRTRIEI